MATNRKKVPAAPAPEPLEVGKRYRVLGYYSGNFEGECIEGGKTYGVFRVTQPMCASLEVGQTVDVSRKLARIGVA